MAISHHFDDSVVVSRGLPYLTAAQVEQEIEATSPHDPITDATAGAIASWWQSPAGRGRIFAALASHLPVEIDKIVQACDEELAEYLVQGGLPGRTLYQRRFDRACLMRLKTWATNQ